MAENAGLLGTVYLSKINVYINPYFVGRPAPCKKINRYCMVLLPLKLEAQYARTDINNFEDHTAFPRQKYNSSK